MAAHEQAWVKVNTQVDIGIAEIVLLLNRIPGLETIQSCQGWPGEAEGYVYFRYGDWRQVCEFVFAKLACCLPQVEDVTLRVETFGGCRPMGKISFSAEATEAVTAALKQFIAAN